MSFKCPNCQTEIYSRASRACLTCGAVLPAELLLSDAQIRHYEELADQERKARVDAAANVDHTQPKIPDAY
jgi:transcription initiation factor TFIIIB Brf1 subunit/transcription initiation factor TFIIB